MVAALLAGAGIGAAGSIIGGIQANKASKAAAAQAAAFAARAIAELEKVGIPSIEAQKIALENPAMVFKYVPAMEKDFPEIKSQYDQISTDPRLEAAQSEALAGLSQRADMGVTPADQAEIDALRRGTAQQEKARQSTILQQMEQQGLGGSGAQLQAQLLSSQGAAQNASVEGDRLAAMKFEAKQAALEKLGNLAGSQRAQSYGEQANAASAADMIAQYNQQQRSGTQQRNIASQNQAQLQAEQLKQEMETNRANTANTEQTYNKELQAKKFEQEMAKAGAMSNALTGAAYNTQQAGATKAANTLATWQGIGSAAGAGVSALGKK